MGLREICVAEFIIRKGLRSQIRRNKRLTVTPAKKHGQAETKQKQVLRLPSVAQEDRYKSIVRQTWVIACKVRKKVFGRELGGEYPQGRMQTTVNSQDKNYGLGCSQLFTCTR